MNKRSSKTRHFWLLVPYLILLYGLALLWLYIGGQPLPLNAELADVCWILGIGIVSSVIMTLLLWYHHRSDDSSLF
jgi:hypothetical protein